MKAQAADLASGFPACPFRFGCWSSKRHVTVPLDYDRLPLSPNLAPSSLYRAYWVRTNEVGCIIVGGLGGQDGNLG